MEKKTTTNSTCIITEESFVGMWRPSIRRLDHCDCSVPVVAVAFDCLIDIKVFTELVMKKLQKQPNAKIEVFFDDVDFMQHMLSHDQVCVFARSV